MRKTRPRKLKLHRETVRVLSERWLPAAVGGAQNVEVDGEVRAATGDTCLCAPTYWETCQ